MAHGKAVDRQQRELVVQLKRHFDLEKLKGPSVSTDDPMGRVAQALGLGKRTVQEIVTNDRRTRRLANPAPVAEGNHPTVSNPPWKPSSENRFGCLTAKEPTLV